MEIVVDAKKVYIPKTRRNKNLENIIEAAKKTFCLGENSDHGIHHWQSVELNGIVMAKANPAINLRIIQVFSYIHDCQRQNEMEDREHGARAAKWATQNKSLICNYLSNEEFPLLLKAITGHNHCHTTENTHIGACWDADRLDLIRVGIIPQKSKFSTNAAKQLL